MLVTGAAGGIGSAICRRVAQDGAHIVATDIDLAGAEQLAASVNQQFGSGRAVAVKMDVTDENSDGREDPWHQINWRRCTASARRWE